MCRACQHCWPCRAYSATRTDTVAQRRPPRACARQSGAPVPAGQGAHLHPLVDRHPEAVHHDRVLLHKAAVLPRAHRHPRPTPHHTPATSPVLAGAGAAVGGRAVARGAGQVASIRVAGAQAELHCAGLRNDARLVLLRVHCGTLHSRQGSLEQCSLLQQMRLGSAVHLRPHSFGSDRRHQSS